jgi:plastocyanin
MTDQLVFDPDDLTVAPGDTVVWENVGNVGHSVTAYEADLPDGADYFASGGFDAEQPARGAYSAGDPSSGDVPGGETFEHTFEVVGEYEYFCIPHETVGMVASLEVTPGGAPSGGPVSTVLPDSLTSIVVGATAAFLTVLGLTYFFMRYGGEYPPLDESEDR